MLRLNNTKFIELQGDRNEQKMADYVGVSRAQLWRIKRGGCKVSSSFVSKVLAAFPGTNFSDIFFVDDVRFMQHQEADALPLNTQESTPA